MSEIIIKAEIINFKENAMRHHFDNHACHSYDATYLNIIEPQNFPENKLVIYHDKNKKIDTLWKRKNINIEFKISTGSLKYDVIFNDAVKDLRRRYPYDPDPPITPPESEQG